MSKIDERLYNEAGVVLGFMPKELRDELERLSNGKNIRSVGKDGEWYVCSGCYWHGGLAYGLIPGWVPEGETIECNLFLDGGDCWGFRSPPKGRRGVISQAPNCIGFRGYRYVDEITPELKREKVANGWRTIIPDAVVFDRAEVEAAQ